MEAARKVLDHSNVRFVMAALAICNKNDQTGSKLKKGTKFHFTGFLKGNEVEKLLAMTRRICNAIGF